MVSVFHHILNSRLTFFSTHSNNTKVINHEANNRKDKQNDRLSMPMISSPCFTARLHSGRTVKKWVGIKYEAQQLQRRAIMGGVDEMSTTFFIMHRFISAHQSTGLKTVPNNFALSSFQCEFEQTSLLLQYGSAIRQSAYFEVPKNISYENN